MTKEELLKRLKGYVVHCPTEELDVEVTRLAHTVGLLWCSGDLYTEINNWSMYKEGTCHNFHDGTYCDGDSYIKEDNLEIIFAATFISWFDKGIKQSLEPYAVAEQWYMRLDDSVAYKLANEHGMVIPSYRDHTETEINDFIQELYKASHPDES